MAFQIFLTHETLVTCGWGMLCIWNFAKVSQAPAAVDNLACGARAFLRAASLCRHF